MTTPSADEHLPADRTIFFVTISVAASASALAVAAFFALSRHFALGVVAGGAIALSNFVVLARVGRALTGNRRQAFFWGGVYLAKVAVLFGGTALLLHSGAVSGLGVVVGFAALVPGIVVGGLLAAPSDPTDASDGKRR